MTIPFLTTRNKRQTRKALAKIIEGQKERIGHLEGETTKLTISNNDLIRLVQKYIGMVLSGNVLIRAVGYKYKRENCFVAVYTNGEKRTYEFCTINLLVIGTVETFFSTNGVELTSFEVAEDFDKVAAILFGDIIIDAGFHRKKNLFGTIRTNENNVKGLRSLFERKNFTISMENDNLIINRNLIL